MANCFPDQLPPGRPGGKAEAAVFEAFKRGLSDEWYVYAGLPLLERDRAAEGECDLVLLHRQAGLFVIECKGFGVERRGDGKWYRRDLDGSVKEMTEGPFEQAQRTVKHLVDILGRRWRTEFGASLGNTTEPPLVHGHAVALPWVKHARAELPLNVEPELLLDAVGLDQPLKFIERLAAFWRRSRHTPPRPMDDQTFTRFRKRVLLPRTHLGPTVAGLAAADGRRIQAQTDEQVRILTGLFQQKQQIVTGPAGTGKTLIALESARRYAAAGLRTLLVCFNRGLGDALKARVQSWDAAEAELVTVGNFHQLCEDVLPALGRKLDVPKGDGAAVRAYFEKELPMALLEAVDGGHVPPWQAIVADEAQDFDPDWWSILETVATPDARWTVVADRSQDIFGRENQFHAGWPRFNLSHNLRSTRAIGAFVAKCSGMALDHLQQAPEGVPPQVERQPSGKAFVERLERLVADLLGRDGFYPAQIVILSPHTRANSSLVGRTELARHRLIDRPDDDRDGILHTTIGKFKGLEADVVILIDIDPADALCTPAMRYVAASRARHLLYVFSRDGGM